MRGKSIVHVSDVEPTIVATVAEGTHGESMGDVVQSPGGGMATSSPVREHCTHPPRFLRMVTATQLDCVKDPHSWSWVTDRHSMHVVIARLQWVTRFTAAGEIKCSLPPGTYVLSWRILMLDPRGWSNDPVHFTLLKNDAPIDERKCFMNTRSGLSNRRVEQFKLPTIRVGDHNWREFDVGEFVVESEVTVSHLQFAMSSTDGDCRTGLFLDGVVLQQLCPSGCSLKVLSALHDPSTNSPSVRYIVAAQNMDIRVGENDHGELVSDQTSLHLQSARLEKVTAFEALLEFKSPLPPGTYTVSWRIRLENPSGWDAHPVQFTLSKDDVRGVERRCFISTSSEVSSRRVEEFELPSIRVVENGWMEYDVGEFVVEASGVPEIHCLKSAMRSLEGDCRTGMSLDGVVIRCSSIASNAAISDGFQLMSSPYEMRTNVFYWEWDVGSIHRPGLGEVEKQLKLFLGDSYGSDTSVELLKHAKSGWESESLWNWDKAIQNYRKLHEELGRQLQQQPDDQQQVNRDVRARSYLWLDTWALVPTLLWQQFVAGDQLKDCIGGWEALRNRWPLGHITHWTMRQQQALALLEWSRYGKDGAGEKEAEEEAMGLFLSSHTPEDPKRRFMEKMWAMSFYLFQHHYSAWRYVKAKQWLKLSLDSLDLLKPLSPKQRMIYWWQRKFLISAGETKEADDVTKKFKTALVKENKNAPKHPKEKEVQMLKRELELQEYSEENLTPAHREKLERQLKLEEGRLDAEKKAGDLLNRINGLLSMELLVQQHMVPRDSFDVQRDLSAAQRVLMPDDFVDRIIQSQLHFADKKYDDALKGLKACREMVSVEGICPTDRSRNFQERTILLHEAVNHLALLGENYMPVGGRTSHGPAASNYIQLVKSYYRDVEGINDEAVIDDWSQELLWVDSQTPDYNVGALVHLDEAIKCHQGCLSVSLEPGSSVTDRLDDLQRLGQQLYLKEEIFFEQMCLGKIKPAVFVDEWDAAWNALEKCVELSSRLLHACWDRRHVLRGSNDGEVFKMLHELLSKKLYMGCVNPVYTRFESFQPIGLMVLQLVCAERARAQTLLLGDSSLTNAARDDLLKFSLDNMFAWEAIVRSLRACGPGAVFVSLYAVLRWNVYMTTVLIANDAPSIHVFRFEDEDSLNLRGVLKKTVGLLGTYGTKAFPTSKLEEKSTELEAYLEQLGDLLLKPLVEECMLEPEQKLIFCASSYLANIPFPIIRKNGRYLFQDHAVSVTPSLRVLHPCWERYQVLQSLSLVAGGAAGVVLANPKYSRSSEKGELPGTESEATSICNLFRRTHPVEALQRKCASVKNLLDRAQLPWKNKSSQGFIHVAAHAEASEEYPKGVLILASEKFHAESDSDGDEVDSDYESEDEAAGNAGMRLSAERISDSDFDWRARLVVLSACDSVHGKFYSEGVHNLPRAFMLAGVPCIVASQWRVDDAVAPKLMVSFYTYLREGKDVASAMRFAMCDMLNENQPVFGFAPFLVWGCPTVCLPRELQAQDTSSSQFPSN